jgi:hypothetical protein
MGTAPIDNIDHNERRYDDAQANPAEKRRPSGDVR